MRLNKYQKSSRSICFWQKNPFWKTPAAIRGQSAAITCRFQLGAGEVFSSLQVYKNDKTDPANHFAVIKSLDEAETDQNWLASERLSFQAHTSLKSKRLKTKRNKLTRIRPVL